MYLIKLISKDRNYFSIGRDYTESLSLIVHSDTLFSAICNNFREIYGNKALEDFLTYLEGFENFSEKYFRLSSCFHYIDIYKEEKFSDTLYFLPSPLVRFQFDKQSEEFLRENPKVLKKIQFVSFEVLRKLQLGQNLSLSQYHILDDNYLMDEKDISLLGLDEFLTLIEEPDDNLEKIERAIRKKITIFGIIDEQRVRISRISKHSDPFTESKLKFYISKYYIKENDKEINFRLIPGYYFLLDFSGLNNELTDKVLSSIRLIIDEGIGGKRSIGCGLVDDVNIIELNEDFKYFDLLNNEKKGYFTNISLVYPSKEEIEDVKFFNIYGRSGFVYSVDTNSLRFNDVKFIEEGAVFKKKIQGKLIQVASDEFIKKYHRVYKNGIGFYLNIGRINGD